MITYRKTCGCVSPAQCAEPDLLRRSGALVAVVGVVRHADATHDREVLPMFRVRFTDGFEAEAWRDELMREEGAK